MKAIEVKSFSPTRQLHAENQLFADGGVIGRNPSGIGGTYAFSVLKNGKVIQTGGSVIVPVRESRVSNNVSEFIAVLEGLEKLPSNWVGIVYSDSKVTLGRFFCDWSLTNIPSDLQQQMRDEKLRLIHFSDIQYCLLEGHPTKSDLARGFGKNGYPVHEQNVWCDKTCKSLAKAFLA